MMSNGYSNANLARVNKSSTKFLEWLHTIKNWILPGCCVFCQAPTKSIDLCSGCEQDLPWLKNSCRSCALPLSTSATYCGNCLQHRYPFDKTIALFLYQPPVDRLIMGLKFQKKLVYARLLGELLAKHLSVVYATESFPECIIPVPLHPKRLQERGFNQTVEIIRSLARKFKIPVDLKSCQRIKATLAQTALPAIERYENMRNAFLITREISFKHVAIVDDVVTTGQTILAFSKSLKEVGVEKIDIWCCARTILPKS